MSLKVAFGATSGSSQLPLWRSASLPARRLRRRLSAKQRAAVRTQLSKEIKKNPKAISRKSFVKRASLVTSSFRSRSSCAARHRRRTTPTRRTSTWAPRSVKRTLNLGGSLSAQIQFHDSYDGGALGNVDL